MRTVNTLGHNRKLPPRIRKSRKTVQLSSPWSSQISSWSSSSEMSLLLDRSSSRGKWLTVNVVVQFSSVPAAAYIFVVIIGVGILGFCRDGPCAEQYPECLIDFSHPGCAQHFRWAPWVTQTPPCMTRLSQFWCEHLRFKRLRFGWLLGGGGGADDIG